MSNSLIYIKLNYSLVFPYTYLKHYSVGYKFPINKPNDVVNKTQGKGL